MADNTMDEYELKDLIERLADIRGRNTELVSLYIPAGYDMNKIIDFLTTEVSEAENIKSKATRKNVQAALDKLKRRLKEVGETPEEGVALFCGNVSEQEGRPDIELWEVVPPEPVESRRYRCDKTFVLDPLKDLVVEKDIYGLIVVDKSEAAIGYLKGNSLHIKHTLESNVPGKTTKGGQCLAADTRIPLPDGTIRKISELDERTKQVLSADFDANMVQEAEHNSVFASRHAHRYAITTVNPQRRIVATGNHQFFALTDEGVVERFVENLQPGDFLLGSRILPVDGEQQPLPVDVPFRYRVTDSGAARLRAERLEQGLAQSSLGDAVGVSQTAISKFESGDRNPSFSTLQQLVDTLDLKDGFLDAHCRKEPAFSIPDTVTPDLARILGYFHGDGSIDGNRLEFYEQRESVADAYRQRCEAVFDLEPTIVFREDKNYYRIRLHSDALVTRLQGSFPALFSETSTDTVPRAIQRSPDTVLAAYLRGLYDAEGAVTGHEVTLSLAAPGVVDELMLLLQRLGITASISRQDVDITHLDGQKPVSRQARLRISERRSLKAFAGHIGFTAAEKQEKLAHLIDSRTGRARSDKIPLNGSVVRRLAEQVGLNTEDFPGFNPYFRDEKYISYHRFRTGILPVFQERYDDLQNEEDASTCEEIVETLTGLVDGELLLLKVDETERTGLTQPHAFYDIEVPGYQNFVANGIIAHNSQQRFERIRENMYDTFLSEIAEKAQDEFLHKAREGELLGLIVGGPGFAKDDLVEKDYLHNELEERVLTRIGTNYSGEEGMHELMERSEDIIQESRAIKEQQLVQEFLTNLKEENGLSTYGLEEVAEALKMGAVDKVLISEDVEMVEVRYTCGEDDHIEYVPRSELDSLTCEDGNDPDIDRKRDLVDVIKEKAEQMDSEVHIISSDSKEGVRLDNMGGIAAILRYRIR